MPGSGAALPGSVAVRVCPAVSCAPAGCWGQSGLGRLRPLRAASQAVCGAFMHLPEPWVLWVTMTGAAWWLILRLFFLIVQLVQNEKLRFLCLQWLMSPSLF